MKQAAVACVAWLPARGLLRSLERGASAMVVVTFSLLMACNDSPTKPRPDVPPTGPAARTPTWSPDGRRIAYFRSGDAEGTIPYVVTILDLETGTESGLDSTHLHVAQLDWSPDGKWIAIESSGNILKLSPDGEPLIQLTDGSEYYYPRWNSDGTRLAFDKPYSPDPGIYTIRSDGTELTRVRTNGRTPDWIGDKDSLVAALPDTVAACRRLGAFELGAPGERFIGPCGRLLGSGCTVSPTGDLVAFEDSMEVSSFGVYLLHRDEGEPFPVTPKLCRNPAWSPDGKYIVYADLFDGALHVYEVESGKDRRVTARLR